MPFWRNSRRLLDIAVILISVGYPFLVYFGLMRFSPAVVGLALVLFLSLRFLLQRKRARRRAEFRIYLGALVVLALMLMVNEMLAIKAYPVMISLSFAALFGYSLISPPTVIERIARLREPDLDAHGVQYTRKVTIAWVIFLLINAGISAWTALYASVETWTLYNGFISYLLIGAMFAGEYTLRHFVRQKKAG